MATKPNKPTRSQNIYLSTLSKVLDMGATKSIQAAENSKSAINNYSPNNLRRLILTPTTIAIQTFVTSPTASSRLRISNLPISDDLITATSDQFGRYRSPLSYLSGQAGHRINSSIEEIVIITKAKDFPAPFINHGVVSFLQHPEVIKKTFRRLRAVSLIDQEVDVNEFLKGFGENLYKKNFIIADHIKDIAQVNYVNDLDYITKYSLRPRFYAMDAKGTPLAKYFESAALAYNDMLKKRASLDTELRIKVGHFQAMADTIPFLEKLAFLDKKYPSQFVQSTQTGVIRKYYQQKVEEGMLPLMDRPLERKENLSPYTLWAFAVASTQVFNQDPEKTVNRSYLVDFNKQLYDLVMKYGKQFKNELNFDQDYLIVADALQKSFRNDKPLTSDTLTREHWEKAADKLINAFDNLFTNGDEFGKGEEEDDGPIKVSQDYIDKIEKEKAEEAFNEEVELEEESPINLGDAEETPEAKIYDLNSKYGNKYIGFDLTSQLEQDSEELRRESNKTVNKQFKTPIELFKLVYDLNEQEKVMVNVTPIFDNYKDLKPTDITKYIINQIWQKVNENPAVNGVQTKKNLPVLKLKLGKQRFKQNLIPVFQAWQELAENTELTPQEKSYGKETFVKYLAQCVGDHVRSVVIFAILTDEYSDYNYGKMLVNAIGGIYQNNYGEVPKLLQTPEEYDKELFRFKDWLNKFFTVQVNDRKSMDLNIAAKNAALKLKTKENNNGI